MAKKITKVQQRSGCPISSTLDLVGDKWSMLIIRDMMFLGKSTYNEFLNSGEGIATNILRDRLNTLTALGIIEFSGTAKRKKYALTAMGKELQPVLDALRNFGLAHFKGSKEYLREQVAMSKRR